MIAALLQTVGPYGTKIKSLSMAQQEHLSRRKVGRDDPVCISFVLQMGPIQAAIDPNHGPKTLQNESFVENWRDKHEKED